MIDGYLDADTGEVVVGVVAFEEAQNGAAEDSSPDGSERDTTGYDYSSVLREIADNTRQSAYWGSRNKAILDSTMSDVEQLSEDTASSAEEITVLLQEIRQNQDMTHAILDNSTRIIIALFAVLLGMLAIAILFSKIR